MRLVRPTRSALRAVARLAVLPVVAAAVLQVTAPAASAAYPVPATPSGLPSSIEALQTYVGQSLCDPVAKPGVAAFRSLVLSTYSGTTDLGIVRDCGSGGQSEHKEGRAWDWGVSVSNATQKAQADTLIAWLLKTDAQGHTYAMARRLGIMYIIWNKKMWRAYNPTAGWQDYTGADPHTTHVHFSFGWNGAKKATSYWTKTVAAWDPGPAAAVTPVRSPANLAIVRTYGGLVLKSGSTGTAVSTLQKTLRLVVDGTYGSQTVLAVKRFQSAQGMTVTGTFGTAEWPRLYPPPINPFGAVDGDKAVPGGTALTGWALDADTGSPVGVNVSVDGTQVASATASLERPDVQTRYPGFGTAHGFSVTRTLTEGAHKVCATGVNAAGTPGADGALSCRTVTVTHLPTGAFESATVVLGRVQLVGWAVDPDTANPLNVSVTVDGGTPTTVPTGALRTDLPPVWAAWGTNHGLDGAVDAPEGTHQVCVSVLNAGAGANTPLGCKSVTVRHTPDGLVTAGGLRPGGVMLAGWGLDPDTAAAVPVSLVVDGSPSSSVTADAARTDLPSTYSANGADHGFTALLPLTEGQHTVCATVDNAAGTPGTSSSAGCRTVTALHSAQGRLEVVRTMPTGGKVYVSGWALDPDVAGSTQVRLSVDGAAPTTWTASATRNDVATRWPGWGSAHGLVTSFWLASGSHTICATAVNASGTPGSSTSLGCRTVLLGSPNGAVSPVTLSSGRAVVSGWVLDPDVAQAAGYQVRVDGRLLASGTASRALSGFGTAHPGYGDGHGFRVVLSLTRGTHKFCVTGVDVPGTRGDNRTVGCTTFTMP